MKVPAFIFLLLLAGSPARAQNKAAADSLISLGIKAHDEGKYALALEWYDEALKQDQDNLYALEEKALTLNTQGKNEEVLPVAQKALQAHPGNKGLRGIYVTYGNALDALKRSQKALQVYEEGIRAFPDFYALYFNKAIALVGSGNTKAGIENLEQSLLLNPDHAGANRALGQLCLAENKRVPAVLALSRFLVLEPQGERAKVVLELLQKAMNGNVKKTSENQINISISAPVADDAGRKRKKTENDFGPVEMMMSLDAALDYDEKYAGKPPVENFLRKLNSVCSVMSGLQKKSKGFYWDYYAPYFIAMQEEGFTQTFSYLAFASTDAPEVAKWLESHQSAIEKFYDWNKDFKWAKKR